MHRQQHWPINSPLARRHTDPAHMSAFAPHQREEGLAREIINRVQKLRKKAGISPGEPVVVAYDVKVSTAENDLNTVVSSYQAYIEKALGQPFASKASVAAKPVAEEEFKVLLFFLFVIGEARPACDVSCLVLACLPGF